MFNHIMLSLFFVNQKKQASENWYRYLIVVYHKYIHAESFVQGFYVSSKLSEKKSL